MSALPELQRAFGGALVNASRAATLAPQLRGPQPLERLAVYRGNVYGNCGKALAGAYPVVRAIVEIGRAHV